MTEVLCATDNSISAKKAEAFAARYARAIKAHLSYVYVAPIRESAYYEDSRAIRSSSAEVINETELKEITALSRAKNIAKECGFQEAECILLRSHKIASAILKYADRKSSDMIVIGPVGDKELDGELLGSVANQLIHQAPCSVTVVR